MKNIKLPDISLKSLKSLPLPLNINLQQRDKLAIAIAGIALFIFLFFQVFIFPPLGRREHLRKQIIDKQETFEQMQVQKAEYLALSRNTLNVESRLKRRPATFALFSFIDQLAGKSGIKGNIVSMKPSTSNIKNSSYKLSSVDMNLNALTMEQLTTFLHGLEDAKNVVWIKRISISKADRSEGLLNTVIQTETFQK